MLGSLELDATIVSSASVRRVDCQANAIKTRVETANGVAALSSGATEGED